MFSYPAKVQTEVPLEKDGKKDHPVAFDNESETLLNMTQSP